MKGCFVCFGVGLKTLLLLSVDSVGVSVVPSSLREDTREAAEQDLAQFVAGGSVRGDPMAMRMGHTPGTSPHFPSEDPGNFFEATGRASE